MSSVVVLCAATAFATAAVFAMGDGRDDAAVAHGFMSMLLFSVGLWEMLS